MRHLFSFECPLCAGNSKEEDLTEGYPLTKWDILSIIESQCVDKFEFPAFLTLAGTTCAPSYHRTVCKTVVR